MGAEQSCSCEFPAKKTAAGSIFNLCLKLAPSKPSEREESGDTHPAVQMKHPEKAPEHLLVVGEGNGPFRVKYT